jgi:hypothetical protein
MSGLPNTAKSGLYANNVKLTPEQTAEYGQCFRYGAPLTELSNLDLCRSWHSAWQRSDTEQLDELRPEMMHRKLTF